MASNDIMYTVCKGDTLWAISKKYGTTVNKLVELNDITDPDYIVVGQKLNITTTATKAKASSSKATIKAFGLLADSETSVYATWTWSQGSTEHYALKWEYYTGQGIWFIGDDSTTDIKQSIYNAPSNATKVRFKVKPVATKSNSGSYPWTADWSTEKTYSFSENPPGKPPVPTITIDGYKLTAEVENIDVFGLNTPLEVEFHMFKDDSLTYKKGIATISGRPYGRAAYTFDIEPGHSYKVRCRTLKGDEYSDWTEFTDGSKSAPGSSSGIYLIKASSSTSVYLEWEAATGAESYEIEYATKKEYFDASDQVQKKTGINYPNYDISGLESGKEYFFRVRAVNEEGESEWTEPVSVVIGMKPAAPTTWSSTATVIVGETVKLYWGHNSEDGSSQTSAELEIYIDDAVTPITETIENTATEEDKDKVSMFEIATSAYKEGTVIKWRVRTAGVVAGDYGDWSIMRTINVYPRPTLDLTLTDYKSDSLIVLTSFPFYVKAVGGPVSKSVVSYHLTVSANSTHETVDNIGNPITINKGDAVYSKHFDQSGSLLVQMSASNIRLANNISYKVTCTVAMDTGLTANADLDFIVSWGDSDYEPNLAITIDQSNYAAYIRPYCMDENEELVNGVTLSVYRREFDGNFVELASGLDNARSITVTDPHPSLDYARYRVVATTISTGMVSYLDVPGHPIECPAVIIQWDENWSNFEGGDGAVRSEPVASGSMLMLPYNIDITESNDSDIALIEYIGRSHPVSYYGTQVGETASWKMVIPKSDKETLYGLRRLAKWMGDVYVREPSGTGYWASVSVSMSQKHLDVTIPVTIDVTRVEGGV